ncbi:MAG: M23 family metallopeptidase [Bacteroidales bacterium]|nr:M23 family metallopeptidase [Bacteroidales bacterium]
MAKNQFLIDLNSLQIKKFRRSFRDRLKRFLTVLATGLVFSVAVMSVAYSIFDSPEEKMLKRELEQYSLQYQVLSDRMKLVSDVLNDLQDRDDNIYRVIFESEPIPSGIRKAGYGGAHRYDQLEGYKNSEIMINTTRKLDETMRQLYVQSVSFDQVYELARNKEKMLASIPAIQPIHNLDLRRIASYFGVRTDPFYKVKKFHYGVDFSAPIGTEIYATGNGKVVEVSSSARGYGRTIVIDHGYSYHTQYSHLSRFAVQPGQEVKRGQVIGYVGSTGKSSAPHCHYEVHKNGVPVNPIFYFFNDLSPADFEEILVLSSRDSQTMD